LDFDSIDFAELSLVGIMFYVIFAETRSTSCFLAFQGTAQLLCVA